MMSDLTIDSNLLRTPESSELGVEEECHATTEMLPFRGNITAKVIEELESDLEFYEHVSLVFLLYDNVEYALQQLKAKLATRNGRSGFTGLLSNWAIYMVQENSPNWEEKFVEGVGIIQNFSIIEKLGYRKDDIDVLFLPLNPETSLHVDLLRKSLYFACERLTCEEGNTLVNLVKEDLGNDLPAFVNDSLEFIEIHFLYWISVRYIQLQHKTENIKNVTKHLKVMEQYSLVSYLESIFKRCQSHIDVLDPATEKSVEIEEEDINSFGKRYSHSHSVVGSDFGENPMSLKEFYHIDTKNIGFCVIINQKKFYTEPNPHLKHLLPCEPLEDRVGTDLDRDRLSEAFGNFGFKIKLWEDLDHINMLRSIDTAVNDLVQDNHSCFVLCILSHGKLNSVYGVNSIPVSLDEIHMKIQGKNCPKLINKPKIIIVQACQGQDQQDALVSCQNIETDGPANLRTCPEISDSFISWSTIPGYASFRDRLRGTWFIQTLCNLLLEPTDGVDIYDVFTAVNRTLKNRVANMSLGPKTMQPQFTVTLSKKLYLPCNTSARKTVAERLIKRKIFNRLLDEYLRKEYNRK